MNDQIVNNDDIFEVIMYIVWNDAFQIIAQSKLIFHNTYNCRLVFASPKRKYNEMEHEY